jgi:Tfp pilus assembly protein PilN
VLKCGFGSVFNKNIVIQKLNLSSNPFRNRTLPWLLSLCLLVISGIGAIWCFTMWSAAKEDDKLVKSSMEQMEADLKDLKTKGDQVQQQLSEEQRQSLVASHKLVARKDFSWSNLFADVESLLPPSVSVARINVLEVVKDPNGATKADLEFAVLSRDPGSVINMIDRMNSSGMFQAELRGQDLQKSEAITFTEYAIRMIYSPRSGVPINPTQDTVASNEVQK